MKVLIIEDELMARDSLKKMLATHFPDLEVVGECGSVKESVAWLSDPAHQADAIFMDVELSDGECFEIFRRVPVHAHVVMTTAYDGYAIKAFEAGSVDYLLKPIDPMDLNRAVERCRKSSRELDVDALLGALSHNPSGPVFKERFLVHFNDRIVPVKTADAALFFSEDKANHVVTRDGTAYIVDASLDTILAELDPERFFKISRSCIVAKDAVDSITKLLGGRLRISPALKLSRNLQSALDLTVSRSRADEFLEWLAR